MDEAARPLIHLGKVALRHGDDVPIGIDGQDTLTGSLKRSLTPKRVSFWPTMMRIGTLSVGDRR